MDIFRAIIQLLGGLAMFLYGIEVMGDGLKNSSGAALKRVLEKVTGNVLVGVLTGTLVTAVIQSSTATIVLTVALIGAGVLNLKQAVSIVMGANIGTTVTAQIIRLSSIEAGDSLVLMLFDTDTLAPVALIVGIILLMFVKTKSSKTIGDIFVGFGVLFVGLSLMTDGVKPLIGTAAFVSFVKFLQNPLMGILFGLVLTVIVQSSSATVGMLQTVASVPGSGITFAMAYPVIMGINLGTCVTTAMVCSIGASKDAKRTGIVHIAFNTIGTILFLIVMTVLQKLAALFMGRPSPEEAERFGSMVFCDDVLEYGNRQLAVKMSRQDLRDNHVISKILVMLGISKKKIRESAWYEGSAVRYSRYPAWHLFQYEVYKYLLNIRQMWMWRRSNEREKERQKSISQ